MRFVPRLHLYAIYSRRAGVPWAAREIASALLVSELRRLAIELDADVAAEIQGGPS